VHVPLDGRGPARDGSVAAPAELLGSEDELVDARLAREEEIAALRDAMLALTDQERTVLSLYYFENLKAREIATVLAVSESRVSQVRARALAHLRESLTPLLATA
jgi:RNA polymerase sigma factor for flagellar operon FliA